MTDAATTPAAEVSTLPVKIKHRWSYPVTVIENTYSGCEETHRRCLHCATVKVTVHPPQGLPYRAWIAPNGVWGVWNLTPPCMGIKEGLPE